MDSNHAWLIEAAQRVLSDHLGTPVQVNHAEQVSEAGRRNLLLRLHLSGNTATVPHSVILKKTEGFKAEVTTNWEFKRFLSDWAGSAFLSRLPSAHAPRFLGATLEHGFVLLEDLGNDHQSLVEPLLDGTPETASGALERLMDRLAGMHADTLGRKTEFQALLNTIHPAAVDTVCGHDALTPADGDATLTTLTDLLEVKPNPERLGAEIQAVVEEVRQPGVFSAYVHGDPCPDNIFDNDQGLRLIDFEFGFFGHALLDMIYPRMMMPTCWCANQVPIELVQMLEHRYRRALGSVCPEVLDDRVFIPALVRVCAFSLLSSMQWQLSQALQSNGTWGITTYRGRMLARLQTFTAMPGAGDCLPELVGLCAQVRTVLQERWSEDAPSPIYPSLTRYGA